MSELPHLRVNLTSSEFDYKKLRQEFVNREHLIVRFEQLLKQEPPSPVLDIFGIGGIGKSFLLRHLYYKHGFHWSGAPKGYPSSLLSFRVGHTSTSPSEALWQARRQLMHFSNQLVFARFDLLWAKTWERIHQTPIRENSTLLPDEIGWISELVQSLKIIPYVGDISTVLNLLGNLPGRLRKVLTERDALRWFKEYVELPQRIGWQIAIESMELRQLNALLPRAFAADIAESGKYLKPPNNKLVMYFDNYETIQEQLGYSYGKEARSFVQDLAEDLVRLHANALVVIAGRDQLHWAEVQRSDKTWVPDPNSLWARDRIVTHNESIITSTLEQYNVAYLSEVDSKQYLVNRRRIPSAETVRQIYEFANGYPLALGTIADLLDEMGLKSDVEFDVLRTRVSQFAPLSAEWQQEVGDWLCTRLLEQLRQNKHEVLVSFLRAASIPRWFNQNLLYYMTNDYNILDQFQQLVRYSFVEVYQTDSTVTYQLHPLMRRLLIQNIGIAELRHDWERRAKEWFKSEAAKYNDSRKWRYLIEVLYHSWNIDTSEALNTLRTMFEPLIRSNVEICWELLKTTADRADSMPDVVKSTVKQFESWIYQKDTEQLRISEYQNRVLQTANEGVEFALKANDAQIELQAYITLGGALNLLQRFSEALEVFKRASKLATQLHDQPTLALTLLYRCRIEVIDNNEYGDMSLIDHAISIFEAAGKVSDQFNVRYEQAVLAMRLGKWQTVEEALRQAERLCENLDENVSKGELLQVWGEYYAQRGEWQKAFSYLDRKISLYKALNLQSVRSLCAAEGWLAIALCHLGDTKKGFELLHSVLHSERHTLHSREGVAKWLYYIGEFWLTKNSIDHALQAFSLSKSLREELGHIELRKTESQLQYIKGMIGEEAYHQVQSTFSPKSNEFHDYAFLWGFANCTKVVSNPILVPQDKAWEALSVLNPAAWTDGNLVYLLYRAEGPSGQASPERTSKIGLAVSKDGLNFQRDAQPVLDTTEVYELPGGCEDPRVVRIDDTFYMTYTAYDGKLARLCMAISTDLRNWRKKGPMFKDEQWDLYFPQEAYPDTPRGWSKSGAILAQPVNGCYWMFFGDTYIWAAYSQDLDEWTIVDEPILIPRTGMFDSRLVEPGPPPIMLNEGIWLGYNAADHNLRYSFGQALLSKDNPTRVLRRCTYPLLEPTTPHELMGQVNQVTFASSIVEFQGKWHIYYGMADSYIGAATTYLLE